MKLDAFPRNRQRQENGSAVIVVLAMLVIMMIFVAVNTVAVGSLSRELKLLEKRQVQRLQSEPPKKTGLAAITASTSGEKADAKQHD